MLTNTTTVTDHTITYRQISALRYEAVLAQDIGQIAICDRALGEDTTVDDYTMSDDMDYAAMARACAMTEEQAQAACALALRAARAVRS